METNETESAEMLKWPSWAETGSSELTNKLFQESLFVAELSVTAARECASGMEHNQDVRIIIGLCYGKRFELNRGHYAASSA
jgi:hypothetical protein